MTSASERLTDKNVFNFARKHFATNPIAIDLSALELERAAAAILTGVLLTSGTDKTIRITLPSNDHDRRERLARDGLLFAVANSDGRVDVTPSIPNEYLEQWRRPWIRGTREPQLRLLQEESGIEPSVFGSDYAAFVNPHRATGNAADFGGVTEVVRPWLHRLLPKLATSKTHTEFGSDFVKSVGQAIDELVDNVAKHAANGRSLEVRSLVLVSLTRGGEKRSRHRLHVCVVDTGPGIIATAIAKICAARNLSTIEHRPPQVMENLFRGEGEHLGRARGFGLPLVWGAVRRWDGARLVAFANNTLLRSERTALKAESIDASIGGTVVSATFPLPPEERVDDSATETLA